MAALASLLEETTGAPVDVEWAYDCDGLQLLQSRPVTSYMPLPPEMQTEPGQRRRLYMDGALSDGPTTNLPMSRLSLDSFDWLLQRLAVRARVPEVPQASGDGDFLVMAGARSYVDFSKILWWMDPARYGMGRILV